MNALLKYIKCQKIYKINSTIVSHSTTVMHGMAVNTHKASTLKLSLYMAINVPNNYFLIMQI